MKTFHYRNPTFALLSVLLFAASPAALLHAEEPKEPPAAPPKVKYQPPKVGAPKVRVVAASRGSQDAPVPTIQLLSPDHVGFTTRSQPTLYWYQDRDTDFRIDFAMTKQDAIEPLVEWSTHGSTAGLHSLNLRDYGVELEEGAEYEWTLAIVLDPRARSKDIYTKAVVAYVPATAELTGLLSRSVGYGQATVYAEQGVWYDAVAALCRGPAAGGDAGVIDVRSQLLRQVGLDTAAEGLQKPGAIKAPPLAATLSADAPITWTAFKDKAARPAASAPRGDTKINSAIAMLAPDATALTAEAQPTLYWFTSTAIETPVELSIIRTGEPEQVLAVTLRGTKQSGIHALRLADFGVTLQPGVTYECVMQLVTDENERSRNRAVSMDVRRIALDDDSARKLAARPSAERLAALQSHELWCEVLMALDEASGGPIAPFAQLRRIELLEHAGLSQVAAYEKAALAKP